MTSDTSGRECLEKGKGNHVGQKNSVELKGKVLRACVTPACLYSLETVALTEQQKQKLQVCENNWAQRITRIKMERVARQYFT